MEQYVERFKLIKWTIVSHASLLLFTHSHDAFLIMGNCSHMCKFHKLKISMMGYILKEFE